jgi:hypothetical protein
LNLLLETSRVEFKIAFPIRLQEKIKNEIKKKWYQMNVFSRPFELGYKDNERSDGVVLSRTYFIFFNTILGELFVHNLLTKEYDWVDSNFYNLPSSAQIFYRRFLLHFTSSTGGFGQEKGESSTTGSILMPACFKVVADRWN